MNAAQQKRLLLVEDEPAQMELLRYNLLAEGYEVISARDGEEAWLLTYEEKPDLILLDWMMPNLSGIDLCQRLKRSKNTRQIPVMLLTARGDEDDKIRGLDSGADDYIVKPYSVRELLARIRAVMRRNSEPDGGVLEFGQIRLDKTAHLAFVDGTPVELGAVEFRLLGHFLSHPDRIWNRDQLLDKVWGIHAEIDTRTVDVHVSRLRRALKSVCGKDPIRTVRGVGYGLRNL